MRRVSILSRFRPGGLSLVELLVAMLLGVVFSIGMVTAYLTAKQNAFYEEQLARMQENGRFAMRILSRELTMSGFFAGLPSLQGIAPARVGADCGEGNWVLDATHPLVLSDNHEGVTSPVASGPVSLECLVGADIVAGSDVIAVKRTAAEPSFARGAAHRRLGTSTVQSWYLQVTDGEPGGWEKLSPAELQAREGAGLSSSYWKAMTRIFYIRNFSNPEDRSDGVPTLCMETIAGDGMVSRCMVEGIEDIQFEFGIDMDADGIPNQYLAAPSVTMLRQAVTVKIHLLLRSIERIAGWSDGRSYVFGREQRVPRQDAYIRRVISATVLLRNSDAYTGFPGLSSQ